jgi:hypothetical protein
VGLGEEACRVTSHHGDINICRGLVRRPEISLGCLFRVGLGDAEK